MWTVIYAPSKTFGYKRRKFSLKTARYLVERFNHTNSYSTYEEALKAALATLNLPWAKQNDVKAFIVKVPNIG